MESPGYYAIIPADVRYSDIPWNAKLLYGEITALAWREGYCYAKNEYFAELYQTTERTVSGWISKLKERGFIFTEEDQTWRKIYVNGWKKTSTGVEENFHPGRKKLPPFPILDKNSNTARPRVRTWEDKKEKSEEYEKAWAEFIESAGDSETRPASISVYLCMKELGYVPVEPPEHFRKWLAELAKLKWCSAKELEDLASEWKLYWMARPEKPVKNHKTSFMNSINFSKRVWTNDSSKK